AVGEPASDHGPQDGRHHDAETPEPHGLAAVAGREGFQEHGLGERLQRAAGEPLHDAEDHERAQGGSEAAQEGGHREPGDRDEEEPLAAEVVREPAREGQHDRVGHEVRREGPGGLVDGGGEAARDVGQRHVDHRRVEDLHERREHHRRRDDPRVDDGHGGALRRDRPCAHFVRTVGTTDMPGRRRWSGSWPLSNVIFTGTRCTTFTKLPVAFSGGSRLKRAPVAAAMLSTLPRYCRPKASTFTVARWPGRIAASCVSLKLAVTHRSSTGTTAASVCPGCTTCPTLTPLRETTPRAGAFTVAYCRFSSACDRFAMACCTCASAAEARALMAATWSGP